MTVRYNTQGQHRLHIRIRSKPRSCLRDRHHRPRMGRFRADLELLRSKQRRSKHHNTSVNKIVPLCRGRRSYLTVATALPTPTWQPRYKDKIRHVQYDFNSLANASDGMCPTTSSEAVAALGGRGMTTQSAQHKACPWFQQWHARNNLRNGVPDMRDTDLFMVSGQLSCPPSQPLALW
jgi:hypothetical protein